MKPKVFYFWLASLLVVMLSGLGPQAALAQRPYRYFYVVPPEVMLRECPLASCPVVAVLYRADQVEYLGFQQRRLVARSGPCAPG